MTILFIVVALMVFFLVGAYFYALHAPNVEDEQTEYPEIIAEAQDTIAVPAPPPIIAPAPAPEPPAVEPPDMAQFQIAYDIVRRHEGGFQIMPEDSGNYNSRRELVGTNWGINAQVYENYLKRPPTEQDMRAMPRHVALSIYKSLYWDRIDGDLIRDQQVANIYFDGHVNHGRWGIQMMQRAVGVAADGIPGPVTLAAINRANPFQLFNKYKQIRRKGYQDLVRRRPKDQRFLRGWLIRIDSFVYQGGGLVLPPPGNGQRDNSVQSEGSSGSGTGTLTIIGLAVVAFIVLK